MNAVKSIIGEAYRSVWKSNIITWVGLSGCWKKKWEHFGFNDGLILCRRFAFYLFVVEFERHIVPQIVAVANYGQWFLRPNGQLLMGPSILQQNTHFGQIFLGDATAEDAFASGLQGALWTNFHYLHPDWIGGRAVPGLFKLADQTFKLLAFRLLQAIALTVETAQFASCEENQNKEVIYVVGSLNPTTLKLD